LVKDLLKEHTRLLFWGLFALGLLLWGLLFEAFAFGLLAFWCGKLSEGKRIAKGKLLVGIC
jgi:hypothetical protein